MMTPAVLAFFSGIGIWEILVILVVALIVFGHRLPEVAKSVGKGYLEFKRGLKSLENELDIPEADVDISGPSPGGRGETARADKGSEAKDRSEATGTAPASGVSGEAGTGPSDVGKKEGEEKR